MTATVLPLPASHRSNILQFPLTKREEPVAAMFAMLRAAASPAPGDSPALAAACARFQKECGATFWSDLRKKRARHFVKLADDHGLSHPELRARFGARAAMLRGRSLDQASCLVRQMIRAEKNDFALAQRHGGIRGRLSLDVLLEVRVLLWVIRRSQYRDHFPGIIAFVLGEGEELEGVS